jgi:eukaryotic-like serine/threonine-protein kinase
VSDAPLPVIAHYNLLERIGRGGIGEVFRARDTKVGRTVALKIVDPQIEANPALLARLMEDAGAAAALSHPNIATLWDFGEADGRHYLAYEFVAGHSLREEARGAIHPRRALDLAVQIADAVSDAHAHGILHGDLRLDTIFVTAKGSAKVLDFGMAYWTNGGVMRADAAESPDRLSSDSIAVLAYMSPEQALGGAVDARTDVFSIGTLTYELVTGQNPFAAATPGATVLNVIQARVEPPSQLNAGVPKEIDPILAHALTPDLEHRQQSAAAFAAELRSVAAMLDIRTGDATEPSVLLPIDDTPDRNAAGLLTGALIAAAAAAAFVWWLLSR